MSKVFQPKANVPMCAESFSRLATQLHMTGELLINRPSVDAYNQMSKMLAALARVGMAGEGVDLATDTMSDICDRYERVSKIGIKPDEAARLRLALASITD